MALDQQATEAQKCRKCPRRDAGAEGLCIYCYRASRPGYMTYQQATRRWTLGLGWKETEVRS
jgi:hypothetical protein